MPILKWGEKNIQNEPQFKGCSCVAVWSGGTLCHVVRRRLATTAKIPPRAKFFPTQKPHIFVMFLRTFWFNPRGGLQ